MSVKVYVGRSYSEIQQTLDVAQIPYRPTEHICLASDEETSYQKIFGMTLQPSQVWLLEGWSAGEYAWLLRNWLNIRFRNGGTVEDCNLILNG